MSLETRNNRSLAQATPILQLSGKLDQIVSVNGLMGLYGGWGGAPEILDIMEYWAKLNKSDVKEFLEENQTKVTMYLDSKSNKKVWSYLIENLDHSFPMEDEYKIDTPAIILEFIRKYFQESIYIRICNNCLKKRSDLKRLFYCL